MRGVCCGGQLGGTLAMVLAMLIADWHLVTTAVFFIVPMFGLR